LKRAGKRLPTNTFYGTLICDGNGLIGLAFGLNINCDYKCITLNTV
jgi:hypothetical protein